MNEKDDLISSCLNELKCIFTDLEVSFQKRKKVAIMPAMDKAIEQFIRTIHIINQINDSTERLIIHYEMLKVKPINLQERFTFIQERRYSYHSFVQLVELTKELEKQYAIKRVSAK